MRPVRPEGAWPEDQKLTARVYTSCDSRARTPRKAWFAAKCRTAGRLREDELQGIQLNPDTPLQHFPRAGTANPCLFPGRFEHLNLVFRELLNGRSFGP